MLTIKYGVEITNAFQYLNDIFYNTSTNKELTAREQRVSIGPAKDIENKIPSSQQERQQQRVHNDHTTKIEGPTHTELSLPRLPPMPTKW